MNATRRKRYQQIVHAFVLATGGRLPESLSDLLAAISSEVPDVTAEEMEK